VTLKCYQVSILLTIAFQAGIHGSITGLRYRRSRQYPHHIIILKVLIFIGIQLGV